MGWVKKLKGTTTETGGHLDLILTTLRSYIPIIPTPLTVILFFFFFFFFHLLILVLILVNIFITDIQTFTSFLHYYIIAISIFIFIFITCFIHLVEIECWYMISYPLNSMPNPYPCKPGKNVLICKSSLISTVGLK